MGKCVAELYTVMHGYETRKALQPPAAYSASVRLFSNWALGNK